MRKNKILILSLFFIFVILSILQGHAYMKTSIQGVSNIASGFSSSGGEWVSDRTMCEGGQDFAVQIEPFGCEPAVVRSDLLEEQNVPVFCQLSATKINPFIGVEAIESISFSGQQFPKEISGVGFYPAQAALGINGNLNSPVLNNIGYAVIVLKKQENSSSMPKMVSGNLTARLKYDIQTAYGVGNSRFYLPEISDEAVWGNSMKSYGFWNGKGYLRAESISPDSVKISVYTDTRKLKTISLNKGETSPDIYLPGFDCLVGAKLKLEDLVNPDTRAVLSINGETIQVNKGEKFLENKCTLISLERRGLTKKVSISCSEDEGTKRFELVLSPKVSLKIGDKTEDHEAGDFLYEGTQTLDGKDTRVYVYLTYIGTKSDSSKLEDLYIQLVSSPLNLGARLGDSDIAYYSSIAEGTFSNVYQNKGLLGVMAQGGQDIKNKGNLLKDSLMNNRKIKYIHYVEDEFWNEKIITDKDALSKKFAGKEVHILNFASPVDVGFKEDGVSSKYYSSASQDYSKVINSFAAEKEIDNQGVVLGEEAFVGYILLSNNLNQKQEVKRLCGEFKKAYPNSGAYSAYGVGAICENPSKSSSATSSSHELTINSRQKIVSLEDVKEPSFEEYGARIKVTLPDNQIKTFDLMKNKRISIDSDQYAQLTSMDEESISIIIKRTTGVSSTLGGFIYGEKEEKLVKGIPNSFGTAYKFEIIELYSKKNAKVSVLSTINKAQTDANFSFNIGIEQRSIKLSPEKTKEKIENLNKTISDWSDKSEKLGKVVEGMKGACLATGVALTMKGFVNSAFFGEQSIARGEIMLGKGGWNERCMEAVSKQEKFGDRGPYSTVDQCIIGESTQIDKDVSALSSLIKKQNDEIKSLQERANCKVEGQGFFFETVMNTECVKIAYAPVVAGELKTSLNNYHFDFNGKPVSASEVVSLVENKKVSIEDMRKLQLYARAKNSPGLEASSKKELDGMLAEIYASYQDEIDLKNIIEKNPIKALPTPEVLKLEEFSVIGNYKGKKYEDVTNELNVCSWEGDPPTCSDLRIERSTPVERFVALGGDYLAFLHQAGDTLTIESIYDVSNKKMLKMTDANFKKMKEGIVFKTQDPELYLGNTYKSSLGSSTPGAMLKCYETAPYKGVPAITPVDTTNGWYVYIPQTVPAIGSTSSVDASGRVTSYYLCNIWKNGQEEFSKGDDECYGINLMTGQSLKVGRLDDSASKKLIDEAGKALEKAQKICRDGKPSEIFSLGPNAKGIRMGSPAANIPAMQCSNFMSAKDCKILFNVCDPVICPSSRCNFGGKYPVADVVQSGIIGSLVLCLPNFVGWKGDVWIPVCLSGLKAGIDGLLSVFSSYRDCLQESLNTGKMTGVCDEIYSIHLCEFFWRQALPLAKMIIPKTIELLMGQSVRGGGEYMNVQNAWANAGQSIEYFTQYYSSEAYATFKARITEGVTDAVCKTYISGAYPDGGKILTSLTQASSPPQFHGRFDEIPFTTATNPAVSHYKVFYHIYAGKESRAYYQVYLTEGETSSYYQDTMNNVAVAGGYIETGGTASETKDFTAPSGYKKLCIVVNGQKECGFKQVSTSFAVDYVSDQYVKSQMSETGITSESDCVSGTASAWSLATISLEGAADELASPKIYNRGIIRVCASRDPGSGTDRDSTNPRYVEVGYCGDKNLKCWLDKDSVKGAVNFNSSVQEELDKMTKDNLERMKEEGKYLSEEEVGKAISEIRAKTEPSEKINLVNSILGKVLMNAEKGTLYLLRANAYKALAEKEYAVEKAEMERLLKEKIDRLDVNKEKKEGESKCGEGWIEDEGGLCVLKEEYLRGKCTNEQFKQLMVFLNNDKTSVTSRSCLCGDKCEEYANEIIKVSEKYEFDKILFLSLMMQESGCDSSLKSGTTNPAKASVGLMQISLQHCGKYSLGDLSSCENTLKSDTNKNINLGAQILNEMHDLYGDKQTTFANACLSESKSKVYTGLDAALRGYNGWGCDSDYPEQDKFVEDINSRRDKLLQLCRGESLDAEGDAFTIAKSRTSGFEGDVITLASYSKEKMKITVKLYKSLGKIKLEASDSGCASIEYKFVHILPVISSLLPLSGELDSTAFKGVFKKELDISSFNKNQEYQVTFSCYRTGRSFLNKITPFSKEGVDEYNLGPFKLGFSSQDTSLCKSKQKIYLEKIEEGKKLSPYTKYSDYSENRNFVDSIYKLNLINLNDYEDIKGEEVAIWPFKSKFGLAENMKTVVEILEKRYSETCGEIKAEVSFDGKDLNLKVGPTSCEAVKYDLYLKGGSMGTKIYETGVIKNRINNVFEKKFSLNSFLGAYSAQVLCFNPETNEVVGKEIKSNVFEINKENLLKIWALKRSGMEGGIISIQFVTEPLQSSVSYRYNENIYQNVGGWEYYSLTGWDDVRKLDYPYSDQHRILAKELSLLDKKAGYDYLLS